MNPQGKNIYIYMNLNFPHRPKNYLLKHDYFWLIHTKYSVVFPLSEYKRMPTLSDIY